MKKVAIDIGKDKDGGVFENEPTQREGVVRESDPNMADEPIMTGEMSVSARDLKSKWENRGSEPPANVNKVINIAEGDLVILENEPVRRADVAREEDTDIMEGLPQVGLTKNLKARLSSQASRTVEKKQIRLVENENEAPIILESEPVRRDDVVHADDEAEDVQITVGKAKNLRSFFQSQTGEYQSKRQPIVIERATGATILESEPQVRDDVVRGDDMSEEDLRIQEELRSGKTKNLASMWKSRELAQEEYKPKGPVKLDIAAEPIVLESTPVERDDVVKCDTVVEDVLPRSRGRIQNIAGRFTAAQDDKPKGPKEMIKIDMSEEPTVIENEPEVREDVVRGDDAGAPEIIKVKRGKAKNLQGFWKNVSETDGAAGKAEGAKPHWKIELEQAQAAESGVFENEPEERSDVIRGSGKPQWKIELEQAQAAQNSGVFENVPSERDDVVKGSTMQDVPQWKRELEMARQAQNSGVFENTPEEREDVVKSEEWERPEEVVAPTTTKNLRSLWASRETEEEKRAAEGKDIPEVIRQRYKQKMLQKQAEEEAARIAAEEEERKRREEEEERKRQEEEERKKREEEEKKRQEKANKLLNRFPQARGHGRRPPPKRSLFF